MPTTATTTTANEPLNYAFTAYNAEGLYRYRHIAYSIAKHSRTPRDPAAIYLVHNFAVSAAAVREFADFVRPLGFEFHAKQYDLPIADNGSPQDPVFLQCAHMFLWPEIGVQALICLEYDVLVRRSLHELPERIGPGKIAGRLTPGTMDEINGGVLVFRPNTLCSTERNVLEYLRNYDPDDKYQRIRRTELFFRKQGEIVDIGHEFNWCTYHLLKVSEIAEIAQVADPAIVHTSGPKKLWTADCTVGAQPYGEEYLDTADEIAGTPDITLIYSADSGPQTEYALTSAVSAAAHTRRKIRLKILTTDPLAVRTYLTSNPNLTAFFEAEAIELPPSWREAGKCAHYTPAVFGKNLAPYLIDTDRFIVADNDIMFRADIGVLHDWQVDPRHPFAAMRLENWPHEPQYRKERGLKNINGGLLVWNRPRALEICPLEKCLAKMRELRDADFTRFPDEDAFLWCYGNDWTLLPEIWNHIWSRFGNHCAVHFLCQTKPWSHLKDQPSQYPQFTAFLAEWRAHHAHVREDKVPAFEGHCSYPPMLGPYLKKHAGKYAVATQPIYDGKHHIKRGEIVGKVGELLPNILLSCTAAAVEGESIS